MFGSEKASCDLVIKKRLDNKEYREMVRQCILWEEFCEESVNALSRDEMLTSQESLLEARDASYVAYSSAHGHPSGKELLAMEEAEFNVFFTAGTPWISPIYLNEFSDYGVTIIDSDRMEYMLPDGTTEEEAERIKTAAPHWRVVDEDEIWGE